MSESHRRRSSKIVEDDQREEPDNSRLHAAESRTKVAALSFRLGPWLRGRARRVSLSNAARTEAGQ